MLALNVQELFFIRKDTTPKGDGNTYTSQFQPYEPALIRKDTTPKGDGNFRFRKSHKNLLH